MDTDDKNQNNLITKEEDSTLHNAGVDMSFKDAQSGDDSFIDIDKATVSNDDEDLNKVGLNFVEPKNSEIETQNINREDLSSLSESMLKTKPPEAPAKTDSVFDLEKEFNQAVGDVSPIITEPKIPEKKEENLNEKVSGLQKMLDKIKEKLGIKKTEVRQELESLKKVKNNIEKDIENIKELEESEKKIESELSKVNEIKNEITEIEKEVESELK